MQNEITNLEGFVDERLPRADLSPPWHYLNHRFNVSSCKRSVEASRNGRPKGYSLHHLQGQMPSQ